MQQKILLEKTNMLHIFILVIVQICTAQNSVNEYIEKITELQNQTLNWSYPTNSRSYVGQNFNPKGNIFR